MNLDRIVQVLKKVNALVENLDDQGQTSAIERDLLLRYLRDLYEHVSVNEQSGPAKRPNRAEVPELRAKDIAPPVPKAPEVEKAVAEEVEKPKEPVFSQEEQTTYYDAESQEIPPAAEVPEPVEDVKPEETSSKYFPPEATPEPAPREEKPQYQKEKESDVAVSTIADESRFAAVFSERNAQDLADKFKLQPIQSIESEMGINQRLQTINELFEGDHGAFVDTLKQLNSVSDFTQAKRLLITGAADKFSWDEDQKAKLAGDFVELVRRKFV